MKVYFVGAPKMLVTECVARKETRGRGTDEV